jgi:hypothetical protein
VRTVIRKSFSPNDLYRTGICTVALFDIRWHWMTRSGVKIHRETPHAIREAIEFAH